MSALRSLAVPASLDPADALLGTGAASIRAYREAIEQAAHLVAGDMDSRASPYSGAAPAQIEALLARIDPCPEKGLGLPRAIDEVGTLSLAHALAVGHPAAAAHLHCPVAIPALAAEVLLSAANQSMDSWDQSPFATLAEERVLAWLAGLCGFASAGAGSFTSGGSQSNLTALHLAFEAAGAGSRADGVVLASAGAHFSIGKSARILGLSPDAVRSVPTDRDGRMDAGALHDALAALAAEKRRAVAIVATAGTTDLGAIDPLDAIADIAGAHGVWLHVDAAYGGGLLLSGKHRDRLAGLGRARSIALDFHKMLFQPISCGVLMLANGADFAPLGSKADYLNPEDELFAGAPNLVERSIQTTRRADALKVLLTCRALGRAGLADLIERTLDHARAVADMVERMPGLELARRPSLGTVLFRRVSPGGNGPSDRINAEVRRRLFLSSRAALATTRLDGRVHLKLTLLNPASTPRIVAGILADVARVADEVEAEDAFA